MVWHGLAFVRCYLRWEHSEGLRVTFGEYSYIVENDILTMQLRFVDVCRFFLLQGFAGMHQGQYGRANSGTAALLLGHLLLVRDWRRICSGSVLAAIRMS